MRIIAGEYRGRIIKGPTGNKTRPTSDRLRETLFNVINPRIDEDTRFLDLCSGTGAIGIEAISRGCAFVGFVDISRKACALIEENLDLLEIPEDATDVVCLTAEAFVSREQKELWDIVFFDPPYDADYLPTMREFADSDNNKLNKGRTFGRGTSFKSEASGWTWRPAALANFKTRRKFAEFLRI